MSAPRSHISGRSRHSHTSHRTGSRDEGLKYIAPPESIASFSAPTVIPNDSVSQAGSRSNHGRSEAAWAQHNHHSSRHSHHSSHSRSNVDFDDRSSGLLTVENLEAHNAEERSRSSTPRPPEQLYVEVVEDRTATGSYYSHNDTPRQSLHPDDGLPRSQHSRRSPSPRVEVLSRVMEDRLSVSKSHASAHSSRNSRSHVSRNSERRAPSEGPGSSTPSGPPTVVSRRNPSHSPPRSSASHHTAHTHSRSRSHAPTSTPTQISSQVSQRTSRRTSPPSRILAPKVPEAYEVAVYEEIPYTPSKFRDTYTVEVEAAEDQERGRDYRIHRMYSLEYNYLTETFADYRQLDRHQYPVYGDA